MDTTSIAARIRLALCGALAAVFVSGCYYYQTVEGQIAVMLARVPIARVLERRSTTPALRAQLEQVTAIRNFASRALDLPDNGSYRSYADVHRAYVLWNVFAAPEFSVQPKRWCYPFVGCQAYRGYFKERAADSYGARLRAQGFDVQVGGVAAYSTLGHFDDPVLSTMVGWDDVELASIIFHELTHQLVYVAGDSSFDEALATMVEEEGVRRWLASLGRSADLAKYEREQRRIRQVVELLHATRGRLRVLYASGAGAEAMRRQKQDQFAALRAAYARLVADWGGRGPFDAWFRNDLNNAYLVSVATYYRCVPGFERELAQAGGSLPEFYRRARALAALDRTVRDARVCGGPAPAGDDDP